MTAVRAGFDLLLSFVGAAAWSLAAFAVGARLVSPAAGGLLAVGLFLSLLAVFLGSHLHETRLSRLASGVCPRCKGGVRSEHLHRRLVDASGEWLAPLTSWQCASCGFAHNEAWPCPGCPSPSP
jgi:zinc transporter ZupT